MATFNATIHDDLDEYRDLAARVVAFLHGEDVPPKAAYAARAAVEELVVNAIRYAFDPPAGRHKIDVDIRLEAGIIGIRVQDDGRPFDPCAVAAPCPAEALASGSGGGWGIQLVRTLSDGVSYTRRLGRNIIDVTVRLTAP